MRRFGWIRDLPDIRDVRFTVSWFTPLPAMVDLRAGFPTVYDQGDLGSCTANAAAGVIQFLQRKQHRRVIPPSRLFCYYHARELEGSIESDAGAMIRDTVKVCAKLGAPPETDWPYDITKFADAPPAQATADALAQQWLRYGRVSQREHAMKSVLAAGFPILIGFSVYESMDYETVSQTGDVPMPRLTEEMLGGHSVWLNGYNDETRRFSFTNSWGSDWGDHGFGTLPYEYLINPDLASDFWACRLLEEVPNGE
jgi:C1A family cysteine protease